MSLPRLVGIVQLPPLAGSPRASDQNATEALQDAGLFAVRDAQIFAQAGFDGILIENSGDSPFYSSAVPPETVASLAIIAAAVRETVQIQVGIQVLKNDARAALAIAAVTGCDFIRVFSGSKDDWIDVAIFMRERMRLNASVAILADPDFEESDGVILNYGLQDLSELETASQLAKERKIPLYLEMGPGHDQTSRLPPGIHGIIVGSELRKGGAAGAALEVKKVREFAKLFSKSVSNAGRSKKSPTGKTSGKQKTLKK